MTDHPDDLPHEPGPPGSPPRRYEVLGVGGIGEVRPGDDLAAILAAAVPDLRDGDVLVVASKIVAKAEGRIVTTPDDPPEREAARQRAIDAESVREVARRGPTRVVVTRHGFVMASAGVDASNVRPDELALLPADPDASARRLRDGLRERTGRQVAVVVSDTFGRPWRNGVTDLAVGAAGLPALRDFRGRTDPYGNELTMTVVAEVDEVASAAELVMGKLDRVPAAVVRGLAYDATDPDAAAGVRPLVRDAASDMFRLGTDEATAGLFDQRRSIRDFAPDRVDPAVLQRAVAAAVTAPAPHHTAPWRFVFVDSDDARRALLDGMRRAWVADLTADGVPPERIARRTARSDALLGTAPYLVVPCLVVERADGYPDARRARAEREMFLLSAGAAIENFLLALAGAGLGSCWVSSTLFCPDVVRRALGLPDAWEPMGAIAVGRPASPPPPRPERDPRRFVVER